MTTSNGAITVEAIEPGGNLDDFLQVPYLVFADDPTWVPPLLAMEKDRLNPKKGAFFKFGEAMLFVARRDGKLVGRISAQIDHHHLDTHKDGAGHFGFFDCLDDQDVANALFDAAGAWLRARGMTRMVGPFNLSINEESGLQIEGFETAPVVFMPQSRPWMAGLVEAAGLAKEMDLLAFRASPQTITDRARRLTEYAQKTGRVTVRPMDLSRRAEEMALLVDIFNDSWSGNWGFTPLSVEEIENLLGDFTRFIRGQFGRIVSLDGVPMGVMVFLPNYNEPIQGFGGKLLPFNWAKLIWAMVTDRFKSGRVVILGIRKQVQGTPLAGAMTALLTNEIKLQASRKYDWVEFGWVLESNPRMIRICEIAAGPPVKRYRMYGRAL